MPTTKKQKSKKAKDVKSDIIKAFLAYVEKHVRIPSKHDLVDSGISSNIVTIHFGGLSKLEDYCRRKFPEKFVDFVDHKIFTKKNFMKLKEMAGDYSKFVITTAVVDCDINVLFFENLKKYCALNDAMLLVIPICDPAHSRYVRGSGAAENWQLDPLLPKSSIVFDDLKLNSNLSIRAIRLTAKQIKPMTGLARLGQRGGSFIQGHPKQELKVVPVGNKKLPHVMFTTGAVTNPAYITDSYFSERTAYLANHDHIIGALVVDIVDDNVYHVSQIQAEPETGNFFDYGYYYRSNAELPELIGADGFVLGDYHAGEHDIRAKNAWKYIVNNMPIKKLVVHDFFNGKSISHHERYNLVARAALSAQNKLSLQSELEVTATELNDLCSWPIDELIVVKSNHDEWLYRYIRDGAFVHESQNMRLASLLFAPAVDGLDPLQYALENLKSLAHKNNPASVQLEEPKKIKWLRRKDSFSIAGHECGAHGDKGASGKKHISLDGLELGYGSCVSGHAHEPAIQRSVWRVGTTSILDPEFTDGSPNGWLHASCLLYRNGSRQMIISVDGNVRKVPTFS